MSTKNTGQIDAKREEFRKYLEKEGVLESLTKALVSNDAATADNASPLLFASFFLLFGPALFDFTNFFRLPCTKNRTSHPMRFLS